MKKVLNNKWFLVAITLLAGVIIGFVINTLTHHPINKSTHPQIDKSSNQLINTSSNQIWTCSMHPQIRRNEPGDCPICGMDLIPLDNNTDSELDPMAISMSPTAMQLANVQTLVVGTGNGTKSIRLNGKIQFDERLLFTQASHIPGRIEKLTVNFTGDFVKEGQVIAYIYSPELVNAQEELFEAKKIKDEQPALFNSAKEKLKNWKLTDKQIDQMVTSSKTIDQFPILANVSGYVTNKMVNLGDYVKQGEALYEIADLSKVWVLFDVYESDMTWVKKGSKVKYTVQSLPGQEFNGVISYIDPLIDPKTRVAQARIETSNKSLLLKPEMFVSGIIESQTKKGKQNIITVPKTGVMWTGKRSVVYIKNTTPKGVSFVMREVVLGASLGDSYVIESGLEEGEEIAVNGTFSIDAAAQLAGKPSMMNPQSDVVMSRSDDVEMSRSDDVQIKKMIISSEVEESLIPLFDSYIELKNALVKDDFKSAIKAGKSFESVLGKVNMSIFKGEVHNVWMKHSSVAKKSIYSLTNSKDIKSARKNFVSLSEQMVILAKTFEPTQKTLYIQHCPMANEDKGADWISMDKEIKNPYFGKSMLTCGEITKTIK